jgi:putative RecB family exonuclease
MPVYSHSKLSTYETCPRQFKLRYIDRIRPPEGEEGIEAFLGTRVHETLEKLYKELILTKLNSLEDLHEYYKKRWERNWHDNVVIVKKEFTKDNYYDTGLQAIANYYNRHYPFKQSKTLSTERLIVFKIEDYTMQGFIDRLSHDGKGVYEIHDYKTSAYLPSQDDLDQNRQLALYQIGIKENFRDANDVLLKWHYLVHDKEFTSIRSDAQLKDLQKAVLSLIKTIERDTVFKPVESGYCGWCELDVYCPAKKHAIEVEELPINQYLREEGVSLVNKYASMKARIKELKKQQQQLELELDLIGEAAVEYARSRDITSIAGSDYMLKISEGKGYQFPRSQEEGREDLEKFIKKAGMWEQLSMLNIRRLEKVVEDEDLNQKIRNDLLKFAEESDKVSVRLVKKREEEE